MRNRELNRDQNLIGGQMAVQIWPEFKVERRWCNLPLVIYLKFLHNVAMPKIVKIGHKFHQVIQKTTLAQFFWDTM